ncbi:2544_t:CDS:1, partial [Racocetra fulgida]
RFGTDPKPEITMVTVILANNLGFIAGPMICNILINMGYTSPFFLPLVM